MKVRSKILFSSLSGLLFLLFTSCSSGQVEQRSGRILFQSEIRVGAERMEEYLHKLRGKQVAIVANQTSLVGTTHLVDTLISSGISIKCVFAPEHGFRGEAGAGEKIADGKDARTGLPLISLYGKHLKPDAEDLRGVDIVIFDIQDVGVRFYTYISTLQYVMEACAEHRKKLFILDRPNPHGHYVDGPVLESEFRSFVGMNSIPVVHGMTVAEYAKMLTGEGCFKGSENADVEYVKIENYSHSDYFQLPVRPSPNLPNMRAVYLYPSLCFFEGTAVSLGRGTEHPFQCFGFPGMKETTFSFTPRNIKGVALKPPYQDTLCNGIDLRSADITINDIPRQLRLDFLQMAYSGFAEKERFFNSFFNKLAGNGTLKSQIRQGISEAEIRNSWKADLETFSVIRKKYLLYPDFE
jgi:uncharacterized protein YbbC (DUF1343 family)